MSKKKILILTYFYENMVGFTTFSYRINLMRSIGEVIVVCNMESVKEKLHLSDQEFVCFSSKFRGTVELFLYLLRSWLFYLRVQPSFVFFMHVRLSLFSYIFRNSKKYILFWDTHPTQSFGIYSKRRSRISGHLINYLNGCLRAMCYKGANMCSVVMPIGEALAKELVEKGVKADKVKLVYLGVDDMFMPTFKDKPIDANSPLKLLYTGSLSQERGRDVMLDGLSLAIAKGVKVELTLIGCDSDGQSIISGIADKLKIRNFITMLDKVPGEKIPPYMHSADIGLNLWEINPYFCMNPPTKLFEYMVAGLPVIVNDIQTHSVYIKDKVTGFIINYDAESFARAIEYIYKNKHLIPLMSLNARKESEKYRWVHQEKKMREALGKYV